MEEKEEEEMNVDKEEPRPVNKGMRKMSDFMRKFFDVIENEKQ